VDEEAAGISRDELVQVLHAENVLARRYFYPGCHEMEPYRSYFPHAGLLLPETDRLTKRVMSLPTGTAVGPEEIQIVCEIFRLAVEHSGEVRQRMVAKEWVLA
jgi:dTDP-4-amino-4,6-dideoxygalactose transaminase